MNLGGRFLTEDDLKDVPFRKIGRNIRIHERASIYGTRNISLGDNVRIDDFTIIIAATGLVELGSYVHIATHCYLGARHGITFEDFTGLSSGSKIFSSSDDYSGEKLISPLIPEDLTGGTAGKVVLHKHVIVGANTIILPGCSIGEGSAVGAMSLVNKSLDPWGVYFGIPAKRVKDRKRNLLELERQLLQRNFSGDKQVDDPTAR